MRKQLERHEERCQTAAAAEDAARRSWKAVM